MYFKGYNWRWIKNIKTLANSKYRNCYVSHLKLTLKNYFNLVWQKICNESGRSQWKLVSKTIENKWFIITVLIWKFCNTCPFYCTKWMCVVNFPILFYFQNKKVWQHWVRKTEKELPWNMEPSCIQNISTGSGVTRCGMFSHYVYVFLTWVPVIWGQAPSMQFHSCLFTTTQSEESSPSIFVGHHKWYK